MVFTELMRRRRSRYSLADQLPISQSEVAKIIEDCVKQTPSAFNSQSARVVLLEAAAHEQLWQLVKEALQKVVPAENFAPTEEKLKAFAAAYGTILYFDDETVVQSFQEKFPLYREYFPQWAQQANGMLQFAVWTALAEVGIGASLQHYNPLIDAAVAERFHIPAGWKLVAQMPFGTPYAPAQPKTFVPLAQRMRVEK